MASTNRLDPIPHPPTKPVVGNMLSLDSTAPVQNLARLAKELGISRAGLIMKVEKYGLDKRGIDRGGD